MKTLIGFLFALLFVAFVFALTGLDRKVARAVEEVSKPAPLTEEQEQRRCEAWLFDYHGDRDPSERCLIYSNVVFITVGSASTNLWISK